MPCHEPGISGETMADGLYAFRGVGCAACGARLGSARQVASGLGACLTTTPACVLAPVAGPEGGRGVGGAAPPDPREAQRAGPGRLEGRRGRRLPCPRGFVWGLLTGPSRVDGSDRPTTALPTSAGWPDLADPRVQRTGRALLRSPEHAGGDLREEPFETITDLARSTHRWPVSDSPVSGSTGQMMAATMPPRSPPRHATTEALLDRRKQLRRIYRSLEGDDRQIARELLRDS